MELDYEFAETIDQVAAYLSPRPEQVDVLGNLQDDYRSELWLAARSAVTLFQKNCVKGDRDRYVFKTLWNYARSQRRLRRNRNQVLLPSFGRELDPIDLETQAEARSSLRALQKSLDKRSWKVLIDVAEANGDLTTAWRDNPRYHRRYYNAVVAAARKAGRRVLQN